MSENIANAASTRRPDGTHRVVITGMGAVSPAGVGVQALWDAVMGRACCIGPVTRFDTADYDVHIAAEVRDFDATEHGITKKEARRFERFVQYAIVASDEALAQSGLNLEAEDTARIACVFGTGIGGIDELQSGFFTLAEKGPKRVSPLFIPTMIGNIAAGNLSIRYGLRGECLNVVTACATGAHSIGAAVRDIRHGYIDAALAGVDPTLYDAAAVDGAGRFHRVLHVTLPCILPTIIIMFILRVGQFMTVGYDKILLLYNSSIYETADVISTFVYRKGIVESNFSFSAAVGVFNSLVNFVLVVVVNKISAKVSETSLW